jgi:hypothetical protein
LGIERPLRRWPQPKVVVHPGGSIAVGRIADGSPTPAANLLARTIPDVPHPRPRDLAQFAALDERHGFLVVLAPALLRANLHDAPRLRRCRDDGTPLGDGVRQRLLDVDILPGGAGHDGGQCMPVIRRGHDDGIHVLPFEHMPEVTLHVSLAASLLPRLAHAPLIRIADRHDLRALLLKVVEIALPLSAAADEGHPNPFVRAGNLRARCCLPEHGSSSACDERCGSAGKETAARNWWERFSLDDL